MTAQAGISVVTRGGEKTLTNQNAQGLKAQMNAERDARKRATMGVDADDNRPFADDVGAAEADLQEETPESQLDAIGTAQYQERADLEVEALNDWERTHLGDGASDSDEAGM